MQSWSGNLVTVVHGWSLYPARCGGPQPAREGWVSLTPCGLTWHCKVLYVGDMDLRDGPVRAESALLALAVVSALCLAFNMVTLVVLREEILLYREPLPVLGLVMLCGFCTVFAFCACYVIWSVWRLHGSASELLKPRLADPAMPFEPGMLAFAIFSMILMVGAKVMVDEIGRETPLGWETTGEWIILYCCLTVQLIFIVLAIARLTSSYWPAQDRGRQPSPT